MRTRTSHIVGLAIAAILLPAFLGLKAQAQNISLNQPITGTESLGGNWSVAQNDSGEYTYSYAVNHFRDGETTALPPEIVYAVSLDANVIVSGLNLPSTDSGYSADQSSDFQESSWTPIDFQEDGDRLVSDVSIGLRSMLGQAEAQDYVADYSYSMIPHLSLSAYMDSAVPEPSTTHLLAFAGLVLFLLLKAGVLTRQYYLRPSPVLATAPRR